MEDEAKRRDEAETELVKAIRDLEGKLAGAMRLLAEKHEGSNPPAADAELVADQDTAVAIAELLTEGLLEFNPEDAEEMRLTEAGVSFAWEIYHGHTPKEMVALALMWDTIKAGIVEGEEED